jgi:hypothetical protein
MAKRSTLATVSRLPNIRINVPRQRAMTAPKKRKTARRSAPRASGQLLAPERMGAMIGAALLGLLDKAGTAVPTVPLLGRAGTLGVASWYLGKHMHSPQIQHAATGFLAIAVYELVREGKIAGVDGVAATV